MKKICDKCRVAHVFLFYAPSNESNEFLCLECAQQKIQDILVVFHDVITSTMRKRTEALDGERAAEFRPSARASALELTEQDQCLLREMGIKPWQ